MNIGKFCPNISVYLNKECLYMFVYCLSCHYLAHLSGLSPRSFWKTLFCPLPKTGGFDGNRQKFRISDIAFYPQKQRALLLKRTKMTEMAGVTQAKYPFAKSTVLTTPTIGSGTIGSTSSQPEPPRSKSHSQETPKEGVGVTLEFQGT